MNYLVVVKHTFNESEYCSDYTFEDAYFQGCEKAFNTEEEATKYFKSFEDWEQDLLTIDYLPFWVPGVSRGIESPTQYYHLTKVVNSTTYQHHD